MQKFILTIGREFGSRGGEIGKIIAETYHLPFYDKNALDQMTMDSHFIKAREMERIDDLNKSGIPIKLWSGPDRDLLKKIYAYESDRIQVAASQGSAVFVGRCAEYILRDIPQHLGVFVYSPLGVRINYLSNKYGLSLEATETLIERMDRSRHNYYKYFTKENRGERHNRQLFLDSSLLGVDGSAELLQYIINKKFDIH